MTTNPMRGPEQPEWLHSGDTRMRIVDGVLYLQVFGAIQVRDMEQVHALLKGVVAKQGFAISIVELKTQAIVVNYDVRRYLVDYYRRTPMPGASVVIGAGTVARSLGTLVVRAVQLVARRPLNISYARDMPEAERIAARYREQQTR
jgi:hypothetical protein